MNDELREKLDDELRSQFEELALMGSGSDEHSAAVDDLVKLYKLRIEEDKSVAESNNDSAQTKDRYIRYAMDAASLILPLMFSWVWMKKGFKFEETGSYTSTTFRSLFNGFKPGRK